MTPDLTQIEEWVEDTNFSKLEKIQFWLLISRHWQYSGGRFFLQSWKTSNVNWTLLCVIFLYKENVIDDTLPPLPSQFVFHSFSCWAWKANHIYIWSFIRKICYLFNFLQDFRWKCRRYEIIINENLKYRKYRLVKRTKKYVYLKFRSMIFLFLLLLLLFVLIIWY